MRLKLLLLALMFISPSLLAERFCEAYITDEWPDARYEINTADEVVLDVVTGLMWKRCSEGLSGENCETGIPFLRGWSAALAIPQTLNLTGFAEYTDWRLPNIEELRSIAAINCDSPAINEVAFPNTDPLLFWTSTAIRHDHSPAWNLNFRRGESIPANSGAGSYVRLVRTPN
ncbi:MAG: DUF1566 domain-containing protein [Xanthomonadales bacterium]|nr:DUF1566 domain-containing protein [Xanthomonadales bacterium]